MYIYMPVSFTKIHVQLYSAYKLNVYMYIDVQYIHWLSSVA